jgi:tetratricopeptide (TPR) repeat protein
MLRSLLTLRKLILTLCICPVTFIPSAYAQNKQTASFEDIAQRAKQARNDNQLDQAVGLYRQALSLHASWVEGWWDLATIQYELNRYSMARESFHRVTILNPNSGAAFAFMGLCDFELGHYVTALKNLDTGGKLGFGGNKELTPVILFRIAVLLTKEGDFERSLDQLAMFVAAGNHDAEIVDALGLATLRMQLVPSEVPPSRHELVTKAGEAAWQFNAHNVEAAKSEYGELVAAYPNEPQVHYAYATYLMDSDPQLAFDEFKKELEIDPTNNAARLQIAFFDLQQGSPEEALKLANESLKIDPKDYRVHLIIGRSMLQLNQAAKAIPELKMSATLAPDDYEARLYLAQAYRTTGDKAAASREQAEFDRLKQVEKAQTTAAGWWYFAGQYYQKGRYQEARDAFHKITAQDETDGAAWAMMGLCDFQLADYANAMEHLKKADQFGLPDAAEVEPSVHYYLVLLLDRSGEFNEALRQLSWLAQHSHLDTQTTEASGITALRLTLLPSEIPSDERDLVMQAGDAAWKLNTGNIDEARRAFEELTATYPSQPNLHFDYGLCLARSDDKEGAIREFQRELEITPAHGDAEAHIALVHLQLGQNDDALKEGEAAIHMSPDSFLTHNAFGWALIADRQFDRAIEEMATATRLAPDEPVTHYSLAQAYKSAGKTAEADRETANFESMTHQKPDPKQADGK